MKEENYNEKELKALEDEIRALGIPYSSGEPDERYFANFRVRLMERIDAKEEKQGIFAEVWSWLLASPLRSLSLGAGLAGVIIAVLLIRPVSQPQVAVTSPVQAPAAIAPATLDAAPVQTAPKIAAVEPKHHKQTVAPQPEKNTNVARTEKTGSVEEAANEAGNFAALDDSFAGAESDEPVNLESLSESELESVLAVAQSMK
jgi:hypothetical protein